MRLKQIKLAGFKSFVDPTTVPFPDNLTAIVGPNGCGKSNIIDAVRWVMGESSAKHLRGDSMTDVIFNGSTTRKPVGQASIELVFDNSDGKLTGEYAKYNEISVRRTVTRDGQSTYYLNGTRCRRKDITDLFLGTGLGPRSYAIIEQGMISRLIESKPQELRVFLEEAAGISKYKERRRETENRIRHTRENMERLSDIREELGKQLAHLQRQANAARKYKEYKEEERQVKAELSALRWRKFHQQVENFEQEISKLEIELEARIADQRRADNLIEQTREKHIELSDAFNAAQGKYYGIGADIARLEQSIAHRKERRVQLTEELQHIDHSLRQIKEQTEQDLQRRESLQETLINLEPQLEMEQQKKELAQEQLEMLEQSMHDWEQAWEDYNAKASENSRQMEVERTRIQHFEKVLERLGSRLEKADEELKTLDAEPMEQGILDASLELEKAEEVTLQLNEQVERLLEDINQKRETRRQLQSKLDQTRQQRQSCERKYLSLKAIQDAALAAENRHTDDWLENNKLNKNKRLANVIKVKSGWERALEVVLGDYLDAVVDVDLAAAAQNIQQLQEGRLTLLSNQKLNVSPAAGTLGELVESAMEVLPILNQVLVADNLDEALQRREHLKSGQSVICPEGIWVGSGWLRISKKSSDEMSVLEREKMLESLAEELDVVEQQYAELEQAMADIQEELTQLEEVWEAKQRELVAANKRYSELRAQVGSQRAKLEQVAKRKERLLREKAEIKEQIVADEAQLAQSRVALERLVDAMANDLELKEKLSQEKEERRNALYQARNQLQQSREQAHKLELEVQHLRSELNSIQANNERAQRQLAELQARHHSLSESLAQVDSPDEDLQIELEAALEKRLLAEEELAKAREQLEQVEREIRQYEKQRHEAEQAAQTVRSRVERLKIQWSESQTMQRSQAQQFDNNEHELQQVLEGLPEDADEQDWERQLESIAGKIQRLGAINLAAIEEHQQQSERKVYLDAQYEDLEESLETLESAIRKIDKETRTKFKDTFDQVNAGLKELFPKVFGGGHAYLELTGEDLLDTGVAVMARPPGKRNSSIHLLSGGEKALTALSLVFSIFRLNPAPFCLLDEVDAPLDDANVGRFCNLVKSMADTVQFIYITHNKVAMEMAQSLAGVTMQEPGASRLVAVDVDEAAALAAQ